MCSYGSNFELPSRLSTTKKDQKATKMKEFAIMQQAKAAIDMIPITLKKASILEEQSVVALFINHDD